MNKLLKTLFAILFVAPFFASAVRTSSDVGVKAAYGEVKEITIAENNKAKEIIIDFFKTPQFLKNGAKIEIKRLHFVKGKKMYQKIGQAKVSEIISMEEYRCKVTKGAEEIYKCYLDCPECLFAE